MKMYIHLFIAFLALCTTTHSLAQNVVPGRAIEFVPYPFEKFNFVSPRYDRLNNVDHSYFETYSLRTVVTQNKQNHFRLDIPFVHTNATIDGSSKSGFGDLDLRFVHLVGRLDRSTFYGFSFETILPTASNAALGGGVYQFRPGIGGLHVINKSKGSIFFSIEYRFSAGGDSAKPNVSVLAWSPNVDVWFKNGYAGYYAIWTYDFKNKRMSIPFDVEIGYSFIKNITTSFEYVLPILGSTRTFNNEFAIKLRYSWH